MTTGDDSMQPPSWAAMEKVAHTLIYDGTIMGDTQSGNPLPGGKWASVTMPTLVMDGGASPAFMHHGAQALVDILPNASTAAFQVKTTARPTKSSFPCWWSSSKAETASRRLVCTLL